MKNIIKILPLTILILIFSCKENIKVDIVGKWNSTIKMKSELASPENPDEIFANIYINQNIDFNFYEDGKFTRTVSQHIEKVESLNETYSPEDIMTTLSQNSVRAILKGNYKVNGNSVFLDTYEIEINGNSMPYDDYYEQDQSQGPIEYTTKVSRKDDELYIEDIKFNKTSL